MSSINNLFTSRAKDFELGVKHFQDAEVSVVQIFKLFKDFIFCAKEYIQINGKDQDNIYVIFEILYKFLNCILDYVGVGSITLKASHLTMACHEIYRATCDLQLTHEFIKKLSMPIFQILLEPEIQTWIAKEILKMYSIILQLIDRPVRSTLIQGNFIYYIARLMDMLPFVDFEFQAIILEVLFRLYTQDEIKNKKNVFFFNTDQQKKAFYSIDTNKFDFSVRLYLNVVNDIENNIKSVLCYKVCMDESVLRAPEELSSFKGLWVDFNIKVRSISFYIDIREYFEDRKTNGTMWEIVTNYAENISSAQVSIVYNEEKATQEAIGIIKLKGPCIMVRQVPQKLTKTTTITMYSTNVQKMKNIFNNDIPKMTNRKIKRSFVPLNRRGYEPLDIISIKSSATNHSSVLNHTINTDIVCNNSSKNQSSIKKAKLSVCTTDKIKDRITRTSCYGESFTSQIIDIPSELNGKNHKKSYSYGEAFRTNKEIVSRNKKIKTDESACGYGEKFLSSLIDIDELFKDREITVEGGVYDERSNRVVVRASTRNKNLYPVSSEPKSIVLRSNVRNNENLSRTLNETEKNKRKISNKSRIQNNIPKQQLRKKTLKENKKQVSQSSTHNSEVKEAESIRMVQVLETHCSPELFSSQIEFSNNQKNIFKSVSADKISFCDMIQPSKHLRSPDSIRDNCNIDPFDALQLEIPNRNLLSEENPKVDFTIEEPIPIIISEPVIEFLSKPANSDSVDIVSLRDLKHSIAFLDDIEPPDYVPDDYCKIDPFNALTLEKSNLMFQGDEFPKVHSTIEEPIPIKMIEPLSIPSKSPSDDKNKCDLKNSSLSFDNKEPPNSDQGNCKMDPINNLELKMTNTKLQVDENQEDSNIKMVEIENIASLDTEFFETAKMEASNFEPNDKVHSVECGQDDCKVDSFDKLKISNRNLEATEDITVDSNTKEPIPIPVAVTENIVSQEREFFETAKMEASNFEPNDKVHSVGSDQDDCKVDTFDKLKMSNRNLEATEDITVGSNTKESIPILVAVTGNVISQDTKFFETAKMNVNYEDPMKHHPGKSLELFNDISENMDSSVATSSRNTDTEPHLPPESKTRIRILANIKIQSAFGKASKSNIHTWNACEKSEVCGLGSQDKIQGSKNIQTVCEGDVTYNGPVTSEEIECVKTDPSLKMNLCDVPEKGPSNVHDYSKNNLQNISEDTSEVVNENCRISIKTYDREVLETDRQNIRNLRKTKERMNRSKSQKIISSKIGKSNQLILPCQQNISLEMKSQEHDSCSTPQQFQHVPNSICRADIEVQDSIKQTEDNEDKVITRVTKCPKEKSNKISNTNYDTDIKIQKSFNETLDKEQKSDLPCLNNDKDSHMKDMNNSAITSTTEGIYKRRKLYNPDFPEELSITNFEQINDESKTVSSYLKLIPYNASEQLENQPRNDDKLEEKKESIGSRTIKIETLVQPKTQQLEKVYLSENKQKNHKRNSTRSTNFKRLDKEFQDVLKLLKSEDYLKKRSSSSPKNSSRKKGDLFRLDFSEFNADLKRRGILKTKTNIKSVNNYMETENNSSKNGLEEKVNSEENDTEMEQFLTAFGRFCGKFGTGQLKTPNTSTKKKLIAVYNILVDIC